MRYMMGVQPSVRERENLRAVVNDNKFVETRPITALVIRVLTTG